MLYSQYYICHTHTMGWLRRVGSFKLYVSFAKEPYKTDYILQKRPVILRSLLIVATPYYICYTHNTTHVIHTLLHMLYSQYYICYTHTIIYVIPTILYTLYTHRQSPVHTLKEPYTYYIYYKYYRYLIHLGRNASMYTYITMYTSTEPYTYIERALYILYTL